MSQVPSVIVFDVNETLSDMAPVPERFTGIGAPAHLARLWFASLLRDGFALAAAGTQERFTVLGEQVLRTLLAGVPLNRGIDDAVSHVMAGFTALPVHPDVPEGVRALRATGRPLITLTNGSVSIADKLLAGAGLREEFAALLSADDAGAWKPARAAYQYAARYCGADPADMLLVAVHPWDIDGAARAGLATAWLNRTAAPYPSYFTPPRYTITALSELAGQLQL